MLVRLGMGGGCGRCVEKGIERMEMVDGRG
jgi:hypothetical protein